MARATAASPAAMVMIKTTNTGPLRVVQPQNFAKAKRFMLTAFSISSIPIRTEIAFLRDRTPKTPIEKINPAKYKKS